MLQLAPGMTVNGHTKQKSFEIQYNPILCYSMNAFIVHLRREVQDINQNNNISSHVTQPS